MELGALVCTAGSAEVRRLPAGGRLRLAGRGPACDHDRRRKQRYEGTDRQCRGRLLAALRSSADPVPGDDLGAVWPDRAQLARSLDGLVADGLVDPLPDGRYALPQGVPAR